MGIVTCMVLMFALPPENWLRLFVWLAIGLVIYFGYSRHNSVMARHLFAEEQRSGVSARMGGPPADEKR